MFITIIAFITLLKLNNEKIFSKMGKKMKHSGERLGIFSPYLVMYGPNEANVGIKGIRSDAPKEAIDAYLLWYRDNHRYPNGRMINANDARLSKLIIDVQQEDVKDVESIRSDIKPLRCCCIA